MAAASLLKLIAPTSLLLAWEFLVPYLFGTGLFLLPIPSAVISHLLDMGRDGTLTRHFGITLWRVLVCVVVGGGLGAAIGVLMGISRFANYMLDGLFSFIHPIPKIAVFPLFLIVFGYGETARVVLIGLSAFFPMLIAGRTAAQAIDPRLVEVCQNYGIGGWLWLRRFILPSCMPVLLSGLRISITTAFIVTIAVEMLGSEAGVGSLLWLGWQTLQMAEIFGLLFLIGVTGLLVNSVITSVEARYLRGRHET
jgi:NitT/TauT family transport system permease protein